MVRFTGYNELKDYIPDNYHPSTVTRSFLLPLLINIKRNKYLAIYKKCKNIKSV